MGSENYLHGFSNVEQERLKKQALLLEQLIYHDIDFSQVDKLLEVGCGVGAQSEIILRRFPNLYLTGVDLSQKQLEVAQHNLEKCLYAKDRFELKQMSANQLTLPPRSFDGAFLCWILEHVPSPAHVLSEIRRVLRPNSPVVVTEVLNSSFFFDPYSPNLWKYWMEFNDYQYELGGDPFVGAKLGNLLFSLGFKNIETKVKTIHLDNRDPVQRHKFVTFWQELLLSGADQLVNAKKVDIELVNAMKKEVDTVANDPNCVFYYSFIQAHAVV